MATGAASGALCEDHPMKPSRDKPGQQAQTADRSRQAHEESRTDQRSNGDKPPRGGAPATGTAHSTQVSTDPQRGGDTP